MPWHMTEETALTAIAADSFTHGRSHYVGFLQAAEVFLYQRDDTSPTGVMLIGSVPDCPIIANAIRAKQSAIEPPH